MSRLWFNPRMPNRNTSDTHCKAVVTSGLVFCSPNNGGRTLALQVHSMTEALWTVVLRSNTNVTQTWLNRANPSDAARGTCLQIVQPSHSGGGEGALPWAPSAVDEERVGEGDGGKGEGE